MRRKGRGPGEKSVRRYLRVGSDFPGLTHTFPFPIQYPGRLQCRFRSPAQQVANRD